MAAFGNLVWLQAFVLCVELQVLLTTPRASAAEDLWDHGKWDVDDGKEVRKKQKTQQKQKTLQKPEW